MKRVVHVLESFLGAGPQELYLHSLAEGWHVEGRDLQLLGVQKEEGINTLKMMTLEENTKKNA